MSRGATARLFAAVEVPAQVREQLSAWGREASAALGGAGWMRVLKPDLLHLTLSFLGSRPVAEIAPLGAALAGCAGPAGELSVGAPLWLPPRRPNVLAVAIHDEEGELERLQRRVVVALAEASTWQAERRRFRAHVTVARMRGGSVPPSGGREQLPPTPSLLFTPDSLVLYRSWLGPAGASYEEIERRTLAP
jgi:2'-5' RNA ligase